MTPVATESPSIDVADDPLVPASESIAPGKPIITKSSDGKLHKFPSNTVPDVIDKAMKDYAESQRDKSTVAGQMLTGAMDPVEGGGQLVSDLMPRFVQRGLDEFNNKLADYSMGLLRKLPAGGKDEQIRQREAEIAAHRGANTGTDYARFAGNILSPVNWLGLGAGKLISSAEGLTKAGIGPAIAKIVAAMEQGEIAGGVSGATQPATSKEPGTEKAMQTAEGGLAGGVLGAIFAGAGHQVEQMGEWVARNYPQNLAVRAVQDVLKRMKQDEKAGGVSVADAIQLVNAAKRPLTLADVGEENTKALAGRIARSPGEARGIARKFLKDRDETAAQRLRKDIAQHVFGGPTMFEANEALLQARSAASRPAYDAAYALEGVWSERLQQFIDDPVIKAGLSRGYELERLHALSEGRPITASQLGVDLDTEGHIKLLSVPNLRLLDMGKRGLDAMIADERNEITGRLSAKGVALDKVRRAYVSEIDELDSKGIYRKAREEWAGYSASLDAVKLGRAVFNMSPEEIAAEFGKLSPQNKEFYRLGVADLLKERLAKTGMNGDEAKKLIGNPWMRDQLQPLFRSPKDFDQFVQAVSEENKMFETKSKLVGGSQTAERVAEDESPMGPAGGIIEKLRHQGVMAAAAQAYKTLHDLAFAPNEELNEKIAKILFATKIPTQVEEMLLGKVRGEMTGNKGRIPAEILRQMGPGMTPAAAVDITKERSPQTPFQP